MTLLTRAVAVFAAMVMVLVPTAASASSMSATCNNRGHNTNFWAYYTDAGSAHEWPEFQYELGGAGTGGKSNVNFVLYENGNVAYWNHSPDSLSNGVLYTVNPPWQVYTSASAEEHVLFETFFDVFGPDAFCFSQTSSI